ncbi:MAG: nucleoside triphosphate pyrophosphohydrolase [Gemmatimonadaceae bacterium]|nr:nucleoside triphosphate pyrophosphohydrolase [Gemmatimonadaceae bacterium]MDQ3243704.1 nucleoside triphosphate pyrophosphohydrolase [Gemmatimonadota bacterium]
MDKRATLNDTVELMRDLRKRCDWDAAQTHESLRPYLIEEFHELDDAIRDRSTALMREELGDVLLQVLFHSVIAEERGDFDVSDVAVGLIAKMKARHPHLYGEGVKEPWEKMKSKKRGSIADGLPSALPPLHRAHRLQDRAAGVGFDWPDVHGPAAKVAEELAEVQELIGSAEADFSSVAEANSESHARLEAELGDLLFACVNLCRKAGVHASLALDRANAKFEGRFRSVERIASETGVTLADAGLERLDAIWNQVKVAEGGR